MPDSRIMLQTLAQFWRRVPQTTFLVACKNQGKRAVMTASSVTSATFDPPCVGVFVNRDASIHSLITGTNARFTVARLAADQTELAMSCASGNDSEERFAMHEWHEEDGFLVPAGASGVLFAAAIDTHPVGSHHLIVGAIEKVQDTSDEALVYHRGEFATKT